MKLIRHDWRPTVSLYCRSVLINLAVLLAACEEHTVSADICYSEFSSSEEMKSRHALSDSQREFLDRMIEAHNADEQVVRIPITSRGSVFVAATCNYLEFLRETLDSTILYTKISLEDYESQVDLAHQNDRFIKIEENY